MQADVDEESLSPDEQKERKIMKLLLKIKNGTPPMRKAALRQITDKAREFGAGPLFNQILPLLMSPTLEDQERHLLVKVIDRILYKLDDLVRPYVHKVRQIYWLNGLYLFMCLKKMFHMFCICKLHVNANKSLSYIIGAIYNIPNIKF